MAVVAERLTEEQRRALSRLVVEGYCRALPYKPYKPGARRQKRGWKRIGRRPRP